MTKDKPFSQSSAFKKTQDMLVPWRYERLNSAESTNSFNTVSTTDSLQNSSKFTHGAIKLTLQPVPIRSRQLPPLRPSSPLTVKEEDKTNFDHILACLDNEILSIGHHLAVTKKPAVAPSFEHQ